MGADDKGEKGAGLVLGLGAAGAKRETVWLGLAVVMQLVDMADLGSVSCKFNSYQQPNPLIGPAGPIGRCTEPKIGAEGAGSAAGGSFGSQPPRTPVGGACMRDIR